MQKLHIYLSSNYSNFYQQAVLFEEMKFPFANVFLSFQAQPPTTLLLAWQQSFMSEFVSHITLTEVLEENLPTLTHLSSRVFETIVLVSFDAYSFVSSSS